MKNGLFLAVAAGMSIAAATADANLIAYWNFTNSTAGASGGLGTLNDAYPFAANQGAGNITTNFTLNTVAGTTATNTGDLGTFGGTSLNALFPDDTTSTGAVGGSLALRAGNGSAAVTNNGKFVQFNISTVGITSGLALTYATQKTGTGFATQAWSFSTDGISFTPLASVTPQSSFLNNGTNVISTISIPDLAAYGVANLNVRVTFSGATNGGGNNRIDNVQVNGTVPTPGSLALLGLGGLFAGRRRR